MRKRSLNFLSADGPLIFSGAEEGFMEPSMAVGVLRMLADLLDSVRDVQKYQFLPIFDNPNEASAHQLRERARLRSCSA